MHIYIYIYLCVCVPFDIEITFELLFRVAFPLSFPVILVGTSRIFAGCARVSPLATLLLAIDGPAAAAKVCEQRRRRRQRPRLEKGGEILGGFMGLLI